MNDGGSALQVPVASLPSLLDFILLKQHLTLQKTTCLFFISLEIKICLGLLQNTWRENTPSSRTGGNPAPLLFSEGTGRRTKGRTGWTASPQHLERWGEITPGKISKHKEDKEDTGVAMDSPRGGDAGQPENILG